MSSTSGGNDPPALDPIIELVISDLCGFGGFRLRALSRAMLSLILGFVLQQAWDPTLDVDGYRTVLNAMIDRFLLVGPGTTSSDRRLQPSGPAHRRKQAI